MLKLRSEVLPKKFSLFLGDFFFLSSKAIPSIFEVHRNACGEAVRGRPVINMTATVTVSPSQLDERDLTVMSVASRNSDVIFEVEAEAKRRSLGLNSRVYFEGADPDHILSNQRLSMNYKTDEREACYPPIQAILRDDFSDIYRPIPLRVTFSLQKRNQSYPHQGKPFPI
ncbi:putative integrin alpha-6-like isoform X3 [Apostichopus japonicus]|uniref:Putative integrin alpha-6-like isoform X3 n=1 Tax=Stichopus japonicus TaxID=307972 RepID=A0A2G8JN76_STIJA|nr:putative integrin alpha-6-like isoform X3 [Apostichopus japonicus]